MFSPIAPSFPTRSPSVTSSTTVVPWVNVSSQSPYLLKSWPKWDPIHNSGTMGHIQTAMYKLNVDWQSSLQFPGGTDFRTEEILDAELSYA